VAAYSARPKPLVRQSVFDVHGHVDAPAVAERVLYVLPYAQAHHSACTSLVPRSTATSQGKHAVTPRTRAVMSSSEGGFSSNVAGDVCREQRPASDGGAVRSHSATWAHALNVLA